MDRFSRTVVFSLLEPALKLAEHTGVQAADLQQWIRVGYFLMLREGGATIADAARKLGVSEPTANRIARQLRSDFLTPWVEHELPKQIVFTIWRKPRTRAKLAQLFPAVTTEELDEALGELVREERVGFSDGRYRTTAKEDRLVQSGESARLGALQSLLDSLATVVRARFVERSDKAFARTVSFRLPPGGEARLQAFYEETLWPFLSELEDEAEAKGSSAVQQLSIFWSEKSTPVTAGVGDEKES